MKVTFEKEISIDDFLNETWDVNSLDNGWYRLLEECITVVGACHDQIKNGIKGHEEVTLQEYEKKILSPLRQAMKGMRDID